MATHIQSGERYVFAGFVDLERFIRRQLDSDLVTADPEQEQQIDAP